MSSDKIAEGKGLISQIGTLKYELQHNRQLTQETPLIDDGGSDIAAYNEELSILGNPKWFEAPWLFSECYLYRRLHCSFSTSTYWKSYDVFFRQKDEALKSSHVAITELSHQFQQFSDSEALKLDQEAKRLLFIEMAQISLFGNRTDLSLLTHLSASELAQLQGKQAIQSSLENILSNDIDSVWDVISNLQNGRIDFVLDNSGFELFSDVIFALYLLDLGIAKEVIFHPKDFPWFVSDVTPNDINPHLFDVLQSFETPGSTFLLNRLKAYHSNGLLIIRSNAFWTTAHPYWRLKTLEPDLHKDLQQSDLVIFKGGRISLTNISNSIDLNYRKLTGDVKWKRTTDFAKALGHLANSGIRILALRTCKADVVVALEEGLEDRLRNKERDWSTNGNYGQILFHDGTPNSLHN